MAHGNSLPGSLQWVRVPGAPAANHSEDVATFQDSSDHQLQKNFRKMSGLKEPGEDSTCAKATSAGYKGSRPVLPCFECCCSTWGISEGSGIT